MGFGTLNFQVAKYVRSDIETTPIEENSQSSVHSCTRRRARASKSGVEPEVDPEGECEVESEVDFEVEPEVESKGESAVESEVEPEVKSEGVPEIESDV